MPWNFPYYKTGGSGSLITFPTLLAVGYPPVVANVCNTVGLVFGGAAAPGYRRELRGQRRRVVTLGAGSALGGLLGGDPAAHAAQQVFDAVVPVLILLACALMRAAAPERVRGARPRRAGDRRHVPHRRLRRLLRRRAGRDPALAARLFIADDLQRLNGVKNVLAAMANGVAAVLFIAFAARRLGRGASDRRGLDRRRRSSAPATAGGCRRRGCAGS